MSPENIDRVLSAIASETEIKVRRLAENGTPVNYIEVTWTNGSPQNEDDEQLVECEDDNVLIRVDDLKESTVSIDGHIVKVPDCGVQLEFYRHTPAPLIAFATQPFPEEESRPYAEHFEPAQQVDAEELIASAIFDKMRDMALTEEEVQELGRDILKKILGRFRPDLFESSTKPHA